MDNSDEDKFHTSVKDFMDTDNYIVGHVIIPCDKDPKELMDALRAAGYEVFPTVIKAGGECKVLYRKKK